MASQFFAPVTGGEERLVEDLSLELQARGHSVAVVTTSTRQAGMTESDRGLRVHRIGTLLGRLGPLHTDGQRRHCPPFPDPEAAVRLRRVIAEERPDVIHAHNWLVHSVLPAMAGRQVPLVLTLHDHGLVCATKRLTRLGQPCSGPGPWKCIHCAAHHYGPLKGVPTAVTLRPSTAFVARAVDMVLPVSEAVARRSRLAGRGIPHRVIPNFIPDALAGPPPPVTRPSGVPDGDYIVFAGDLAYDKGITTLFSAYERLADPPPLVLAGRRIPRQRLGPPPRGTTFLGPRPHAELMSIFRGAAAVVVPSIWDEPFGLVALEGMACGVPVVASRVGGLVDIVEDGVTGLLVDPADDGALADAIARLLASPDLRARLGAAGRERAALFAAREVVPRVEAVYEELVGRASAPRPGGVPTTTGPRD